MAVSESIIPPAVGSAVHVVTQAFKVGGADVQLVTSGAGSVFAVEVDNTLNGATTYFKLYDTVGAVNLVTDDPHMILMCPASTKIQYTFDIGVAVAAGVTVVAVTLPGTGGTDTPTGAVSMRILD